MILVAGLPGCGKTTTLRLMRNAGLRAFDDFKAGAHNDSPAFQDSRHYRDLVSALRRSEDCVVADIDFCSAGARAEAERILRDAVAGLEIEWLFYQTAPRWASGTSVCGVANLSSSMSRNYTSTLPCTTFQTTLRCCPSAKPMRSSAGRAAM